MHASKDHHEGSPLRSNAARLLPASSVGSYCVAGQGGSFVVSGARRFHHCGLLPSSHFPWLAWNLWPLYFSDAQPLALSEMICLAP